jgi:hypothetical protein
MSIPTLTTLSNKILAFGTILTSRLNLFPANVSPLGSFGFFGNPLIFLASIIVFDLTIGGLYRGFWFTYLGFAMYPLMGLIAKRLQKHSALILLPTASFLFFLVSNFGSWYYWYPRSIEGLILCYSLAIPFYVRTLMGDLTFGYSYLFWQSEARKKVQKIILNTFSLQSKRFFLSK